MKMENANGLQPVSAAGTNRRKGRKATIRWTAMLGLGLLLSTLTLRADAATAIYFYTATGVQNVSAFYSYQQHILFDSYNNVVATVDDNGYIYDISTNALIGYVDAGPEGGFP